MYLLETTTLKLRPFISPDQVQYAILSHRWTEEEVTFEDIQDLSSCRKRCVAKVTSFCEIALALGYNWCWIDTCCIDKTSSAELSEAINSMFYWYRDAGVCIVYLEDVLQTEICSALFEPEFRASAWFTRSWTLQELLAPARNLSFYNGNWQYLGSRESLSGLVCSITTIEEAALLGLKSLNSYCIAERMSWASMRTATRVEDIAYSLLGIFDIQMPLVYGEGRKAFRRLQHAIMSVSDDETIFTWESTKSGLHGLLALSPASFAPSRHYQRVKAHMNSRSTYELTPRGVKFHSAQCVSIDTQVKALLLNVAQKLDKSEHCVGIYLRTNFERNGYDRVEISKAGAPPESLWRGSPRAQIKVADFDSAVYVPFDQDKPMRHDLNLTPDLRSTVQGQISRSKIKRGFDVTAVPTAMLQLASDLTRDDNRWLLDARQEGSVCNIAFDPPFHGVSLIHLGIDGSAGLPVCTVLFERDGSLQAPAPSDELITAIRRLTIDYSSVKPMGRVMLPERTNHSADWHLQIWPPLQPNESQWYRTHLWQHPKEQPDHNYFCPFPFLPKLEQSRKKYPVARCQGWGFELIDAGAGKWKFGLARYMVVSNWPSKRGRPLTMRPEPLSEYIYSIDLDTFKSIGKIPGNGIPQRTLFRKLCCIA